MRNRIIEEAYWLRAVACLAVVVTHAVNTTLANYDGSLSQFQEYLLIFTRFIFFFGTPAFVFISEMLLARAYQNGLPDDFLRKRVKFLLIPFAVMGIVFAMVENPAGTIMQSIFLNLFAGGYTGYFILIIFQFYVLHYFLSEHMKKWRPVRVIAAAFALNIAYLAFFNFTPPPTGAVGDYIWTRGYWLPFAGWIFYFALGYYCGLYFETVREKIREHRKIIFTVPAVSLVLLTIFVRGDIITEVSSKRIDMLLYTAAMIMIIIYFASRLKRAPAPVLFISRYSFNIYLLHKLFLYYLPHSPAMDPLVYFALAMVYAVAMSIAAAKMLSFLRLSQFVIGKPLPVPRREKAVGGT
ncbi:acyltransferase family protein [Alteribacter natronophilus]|uniref:acyltransferase family protein n=1 Tax=Alteribacter natronophilus TaxID=2583810 RepID=UPI00110E2291|nr:acyltransferase family protein [Alteribacter natronophilus]TMW70925.1 adhesin [Alteribacter natronophilus]